MNLRSDNVTKGAERAPNRSLFCAMGYTKEELERPLIGVVSAHSEIVPGHFHLDKIAEAVKAGVRMAGGTPIEIPSIGVCDGIAMGHIGMKYSLASRGASIGQVSPEAADGGNIGLIEEGDIINIDIPNASINVEVSDEEFDARRAKYVAPEPNVKTGWLSRYARLVSGADKGAIMK